MIFVSYALHHDNDSYQIYNPKTNYVYNRRDVIWLAHMYYTIAIPSPVICNEPEIVIDAEIEGSNCKSEAGENGCIVEVNADNNATKHEDSHDEGWITFQSGRVVRPSAQLIDEMAGTTAKQNYYLTLMELDESKIMAIELAMVIAGISGGFNHTSELHVMNFKQAIQSKNTDKWKEEV